MPLPKGIISRKKTGLKSVQLGKKDSEMPGQTAPASDHIVPLFTLIKTNLFDLWDPFENLLSVSLQCISINEFSFVLLVSPFCYLYADTFSFTDLLSFSCPVLPLGGTSICMVFGDLYKDSLLASLVLSSFWCLWSAEQPMSNNVCSWGCSPVRPESSWL